MLGRRGSRRRSVRVQHDRWPPAQCRRLPHPVGINSACGVPHGRGREPAASSPQRGMACMHRRVPVRVPTRSARLRPASRPPRRAASHQTAGVGPPTQDRLPAARSRRPGGFRRPMAPQRVDTVQRALAEVRPRRVRPARRWAKLAVAVFERQPARSVFRDQPRTGIASRQTTVGLGEQTL